MSGIDEARKVAEGLKKDTNTKQEKVETAMAELKQNLAKISADPELVKMYQDSAEVGAGNLAGELPLLKIYSTGKSIAELKDGTEPKNGSFFYKPLQKQFDGVTCHILTISRGFRAEGMVDKKSGEKGEPKFNQVVGGVIIDGSELLPFVMYFTGLKLSRLWEFGKEASKYTKMKPVPVPMFALTVKLGTEQVVTTYGKSWVVNFEILKNDDGFPVVIGDQTLFSFLKKNVVTMEDTLSSLIAAKSTEEQIQTIDEADPTA